MKIFATSDIHGNLELMNELIHNPGIVDLVLYCGDVARGPAEEALQLRDLKNMTDTFEKLDAPARFVRGNCDNFQTDSEYYLSKPEIINGIKFVPFESILTTPFGTFREVNEEQMAKDLEALGDCCGAVVVAHNPPFGAGDEIGGNVHVGSHAIREWIEKMKPKMWLCGHVHEAFGEYMIGETIVLNCASDATNNELRGWEKEI